MEIELKHIQKHFGRVQANQDINLKIMSGSIQGILGENGAGKSTLMKILSGFIQADRGEIILDSKRVVISSPADAILHGIGMLHQDPLDFPPMRVIDNFLIGKAGPIIPDRQEALKGLMEMQQKLGFSILPSSYVDMLTVGERQQLEIMRLLWLGARVLILDEPTTGISAIQKEKLFETLKQLAKQGLTVIFVSHKLEDVELLCGNIAVLRRGRLVGTVEPPYSTDRLVEMMFGKVVGFGGRSPCFDKEKLLTLSDISIEDYRLDIKNVNFSICRGEIVGLAGMEGSGQRQYLRMLAGLLRPVSGKIIIDGRDLTGKPYHTFLKNGVSYMPAARLEEGLFPGLTLTDHFILAGEQGGFFINRENARMVSQKRIQEFSIFGTPASTVESLSGGNQQRALLALQRPEVKLLLLEHPTRGLDIESSLWVWEKLRERCRQGTSIFFISADLEEILQYSDRVLVFFGGKVSQPLEADVTSTDQLGQLIGGKGWEF
jgi:simple sugar transport system ATP-binding protein